MSEIPQEAIVAGVAAIPNQFRIIGPEHFEVIVLAVLEAAEKAWPHSAPGHDYASTTAATTSIAPQPYSHYYGHRFGFGKPQPEVK